jgi:hypothetical protein
MHVVEVAAVPRRSILVRRKFWFSRLLNRQHLWFRKVSVACVHVGKKSREEWDKGLDATVKNKLEITGEETSRPCFEVLSQTGTEENQKNLGRCSWRSHHIVIVKAIRQDNKPTLILKLEFYPVLKCIPHHDVWGRGGGRSFCSLILTTLLCGGLRGPRHSPFHLPSVRILLEARWAAMSVRTWWRESYIACRELNPDCPFRSQSLFWAVPILANDIKVKVKLALFTPWRRVRELGYGFTHY